MYSSNEHFVREANEVSFKSDTILDTHFTDIISEYSNLEKLTFDTCTFPGETAFEDAPVAENAVTLTDIVIKSSVTLDPGATSDGVPVAWATAVEIALIDVSGNSWTVAQVDAFINALDTAVIAGLGGSAAACVLTITGNSIPTAASATAVSNLEGYSPAWTVTVDA